MVPIMDVNMIGLCGMNSSLYIAYQFIKNNLNKQGFHKKYCPELTLTVYKIISKSILFYKKARFRLVREQKAENTGYLKIVMQ